MKLQWEYLCQGGQVATGDNMRFYIYAMGETCWLLTFSLGDAYCEGGMLRQPMNCLSIEEAKALANSYAND
jgi:hypothetical protein